MPDTVRTQPVARNVYSRGCTRAIQVPTFSSRQPREKAERTLKYRPMSRTLHPLQERSPPAVCSLHLESGDAECARDPHRRAFLLSCYPV